MSNKNYLKPSTIMVQKSPNWHDLNGQQNSARTAYIEDSSPEPTQRHKQNMLTGNKFRETLPLITDADKLSTGQDFSARAIKEEIYTTDSRDPTTNFEDYRNNMQTGSMAIDHNDEPSRLSIKIQTNPMPTPSPLSPSRVSNYSPGLKGIPTEQQQLSMKGFKKGGKKRHRNNNGNDFSGLMVSPRLNGGQRHQSSKGLPELVGSSIPRMSDQKRRKIADQLQYSSFRGYDLQRRSPQDQDAEIADLLKGTVTLREGWRKAMLPSLVDLKNNSRIVGKDGAVMAQSIAVSGAKRSPRGKKLGPKDRKLIDYESSRVKSVINETNVNGRQSVKNLLSLFIPDVTSSSHEHASIGDESVQASLQASMLPSLRDLSNTPPPVFPTGLPSNDDYQMMEASVDRLLHGKRSKQRLEHSPSLTSIKQTSARKTTLRNSEGYVLYRSLVQPVKRVILHREVEARQQVAPDSPVGTSKENPTFMKHQVALATMGPKAATRSVSPINYDNGLGYAPKTIRIFSNNRPPNIAIGPVLPRKLHHNGALLDQDNIFTSLAHKGRFRSRPGQLGLGLGRTAQARVASKLNVVNPTSERDPMTDYATSQQCIDLRVAKSKLDLHGNLVYKTEHPSRVSLLGAATPGASDPLAATATNAIKGKKHLAFSVENQKDWAPVEIASRSQVYSYGNQESLGVCKEALHGRPVHELSQSSLEQLRAAGGSYQNTFASLAAHSVPDAHLDGSYIKVSNDLMASTLQTINQAEPTPFSKITNEESLPSQGFNLDLNQLAKTLHEPSQIAQMAQLKGQEVQDVVNQGTQLIEETPDELLPENESEWARAVKDVVQESHRQSQHQVSTSLERALRDSHRLLINVDSTRLIADKSSDHLIGEIVNNTSGGSSGRLLMDYSANLPLERKYSPRSLIGQETNSGTAKPGGPNQTHFPTTERQGNNGFSIENPPPQSSSSTMFIAPLSPVKRPTMMHMKPSGELLRDQAPPPVFEATPKKVLSKNEQHSNTDIKEVMRNDQFTPQDADYGGASRRDCAGRLADLTDQKLTKEKQQLQSTRKGITMSEFKQANPQPVGAIMTAPSTSSIVLCDGSQSELERSQKQLLALQDSQNSLYSPVAPYGFTLRQRDKEDQGASMTTILREVVGQAGGILATASKFQESEPGSVVQGGIYSQRKEPVDSLTDKQQYAIQLQKHSCIHPVLLEALKKTKRVRINEPVRKREKSIRKRVQMQQIQRGPNESNVSLQNVAAAIQPEEQTSGINHRTTLTNGAMQHTTKDQGTSFQMTLKSSLKMTHMTQMTMPEQKKIIQGAAQAAATRPNRYDGQSEGDSEQRPPDTVVSPTRQLDSGYNVLDDTITNNLSHSPLRVPRISHKTDFSPKMAESSAMSFNKPKKTNVVFVPAVEGPTTTQTNSEEDEYDFESPVKTLQTLQILAEDLEILTGGHTMQSPTGQSVVTQENSFTSTSQGAQATLTSLMPRKKLIKFQKNGSGEVSQRTPIKKTIVSKTSSHAAPLQKNQSAASIIAHPPQLKPRAAQQASHKKFKANKGLFSPQELSKIKSNEQGPSMLMRIQQIVSSNRYDMPEAVPPVAQVQAPPRRASQEPKHQNLNQDLPLEPRITIAATKDGIRTRSPLSLNLKVIKSNGITSLKGQPILAADSQSEESQQRLVVKNDEMTMTLGTPTQETSNVATQMKIREEVSTRGLSQLERGGQPLIQLAIGVTTVLEAETPAEPLKSKNLHHLPVDNSLPFELKQTVLRRSAERFLTKQYQQKIIINKPLRDRKHTQDKTKDNQPDQDGYDQVNKLAAHEQSISTQKGPIVEQVFLKGVGSLRNGSKHTSPQKFASQRSSGDQSSLKQKHQMVGRGAQGSGSRRYADRQESKLSGDLEHLDQYTPSQRGREVHKADDTNLGFVVQKFSKVNMSENRAVELGDEGGDGAVGQALNQSRLGNLQKLQEVEDDVGFAQLAHTPPLKLEREGSTIVQSVDGIEIKPDKQRHDTTMDKKKNAAVLGPNDKTKLEDPSVRDLIRMASPTSELVKQELIHEGDQSIKEVEPLDGPDRSVM